jgi:outer membrane protein OmpA-like peptidoglycan-associated protein
MLFSPVIIKRGSKGEAEKPFWISYADLMTALMVLFLVVMSVALLAVTKTVSEIERQKAEREQDIAKLLDEVEEAADRYPGVKVDKDRRIIDFGDRARFDKGKNTLTADQTRLLRAFVPEVLAIARNELGRKWLKQVVVEGFASPEGDYLHNLNLSLQRSQRVLCVLLAQPYADESGMSQAELEQIRDLFLVGGYSFNAAKASYDESRRVELRLEFLSLGESRPSNGSVPPGNFGHCALGE